MTRLEFIPVPAVDRRKIIDDEAMLTAERVQNVAIENKNPGNGGYHCHVFNFPWSPDRSPRHHAGHGDGQKLVTLQRPDLTLCG